METTGIPARRAGRKKARYLQSYDLQVNEYLLIGQYSKDLMQKVGSFVYYFNRTQKPKKLVQRAVDGELRLYRAN